MKVILLVGKCSRPILLISTVLLFTLHSIACGDNEDGDDNSANSQECTTPPGVEIDTGCGTCQSGLWQCSREGVVECIGDKGEMARNECGGCIEFEVQIDEACGRCDSGLWACDRPDNLICYGEDDEDRLNICGGCDPLIEELGSGCGTCDTGIWQCGDDGGLSCEGDLGEEAFNDCGECGEVELNECGECGELVLNSCGGCQELAGEPGEYCDSCTAAQFFCEDEDTLACRGSDSCAFTNTCEFDDDCTQGYCSRGYCAPLGFVYIPSGDFLMGAPPEEAGYNSSRENGQHHVTLTYAFFMKETTVTKGEWNNLMGSEPSYFEHCGDECPVELVNWWEMLTYANELSRQEGLEECYNLQECEDDIGVGCDSQSCQGYACSLSALQEQDLDLHCTGYRLPTEAEWEYAARAGTTTPFLTESGQFSSWSSSNLDLEMDAIAWYRGNSSVTYPGGVECADWYDGAQTCGIHPVAQKEPNNWGLFDMTGNVWERVWDWVDEYPEPGSSEVDPTGPDQGSQKRMRGGPFNATGQYLRVAYPTGPAPRGRHYNTGFRLVRAVPTVVD